MSAPATYEEIKALTAAIKAIRSIEDVNSVFDIINSDQRFQTQSMDKIIFRIMNCSYHNDTITKLYSVLRFKLVQIFKPSLYEIGTPSFEKPCFVEHITETGSVVYDSDSQRVIIPRKGDQIIVRTHAHTIATFTVNASDATKPFKVIISNIDITTSEITPNISIDIHNIDYFSNGLIEEACDDEEYNFITAIKADDIDSFTDLINEYSTYKRKLPQLHNIGNFSEIEIIEFAAVCASVKCFRFLYLNDYYTEYKRLKKLIIIGGSLEIMRMVNFTSWVEPEKLFPTVCKTSDKGLLEYWLNHFDLPETDRAIVKILRACLLTTNYEALEMLYDKKFFSFDKYMKFFPHSVFKHNIQAYIRFGGTYDKLPLKFIPFEHYQEALGSMKLCYEVNAFTNTYMKCLNKSSNLDANQLREIKNFMYPQGIPLNVKQEFVYHLKHFSIGEEKLITIDIFDKMEISVEDTLRLIMRPKPYSTDHCYLFDHLLTLPAKRVDIEIYRMLLHSNYIIPRVNKKVIGKTTPEQQTLFNEFNFVY